MANFDQQQYNIAVEGEAANILSHFNHDFIFNVIQDNSMNRITNHLQMVNVVSAIETQLKFYRDQYTNETMTIMDKRNDIYKNIIEFICSSNNLYCNIDNIDDLYNIAFYLYDIFISNFKENLIRFYTYIILKEKNEIFKQLDMNEYKRKKDTSTIYGKKLYKNPKIAVINANLDIVLNYIFNVDYTFEDVINTIYDDKNVVRYITSNVYDTSGSFFRNILVSPFNLNDDTRIHLINAIRLRVHSSVVE